MVNNNELKSTTANIMLTVIWCWVDPRRCCHFT